MVVIFVIFPLVHMR